MATDIRTRGRRTRRGFTPVGLAVEVAGAGALACAAGGAVELPGPKGDTAVAARTTQVACTGACGVSLTVDPVALFGPAAAETGVVLTTQAADWSARATVRGDGTVRLIAADDTAAAVIWSGALPPLELAKLAAVQAAQGESTDEEIAARAWTLSLKRKELAMTAAIHQGGAPLVSGMANVGGWPEVPVVVGEVRSDATGDGVAQTLSMAGSFGVTDDDWTAAGCAGPDLSPVAEAAPVVPVATRGGGLSPDKRLLYAGVGSIVAAGGLYALSAVQRGKFDDLDTPYEDLDGHRTLTNASFAGAVVLGVAGAGLTGTAFLTVAY